MCKIRNHIILTIPEEQLVHMNKKFLEAEIKPRTSQWGARQLTEGCIIWAEFVPTRVGCSETTENFYFAAYDRFYRSKNRFQTWPNDATLSPVSSGAPRSQPWSSRDNPWTTSSSSSSTFPALPRFRPLSDGWSGHSFRRFRRRTRRKRKLVKVDRCAVDFDRGCREIKNRLSTQCNLYHSHTKCNEEKKS